MEAARRVGVSFPTEAHPLHENEGVELWTQSSARWTCSCSRGQSSDACTTVFLSLVFENILYQGQCMYSLGMYIVISTQPVKPNCQTLTTHTAAFSSREAAKATLRFDVQADDQGKAVAVAVKPVLGRKPLGEKGGRRRSVVDFLEQFGLIPCLGLALWCPSCFATHFLR